MRKIFIPTVMAAALCGASTLAMAQTTAPAKAPVTTTQTAPAAAVVTITEADAKGWVNKRIYSATGSDIGEISGYQVGSDGHVSYFKADIGGFLGLGETHVQVEPAQFSMRDGKLYLNMTKEQALKLPRATK